ncbi:MULTISPECIES: glutamine synthetase III [unclassified Clostridium]|uniref:glutamine synthetase III family protein n=1 Tax=Clostridium TaxID=1485 RepID=UPI001C8BCEC1|nr:MULTISPECIES: glutamine synthetase III [unclassified Clostridium]MBX9136510.1 glutamine synthetase type III [Clostridium sp. K12(2020)]MBX9143009.1 glutamine synthetase type III [Clostridium sp. K13]MDU2291115.1 glutamine synthetase III [Clostridium celatum]
MKYIPNLFGSLVFNDSIMKARLPKETYKSLKNTIQAGKPLNLEVATVVANAMKDWAIEKGATHYTHWFQPMTGVTAEKHDSFITPDKDGHIIMEFSGKELVQGEPDASSFPSGGLRATFEARGYTAWDPTSYAFIKDGTLCIPTAFCSYSGEALDKKTPVLRSMQALNKQALRILRLFGNTTVEKVITTVGPEQEYFLVDKEMYEKRPDLVFCGRTLFGARPPKGQEMEDHYFGTIKPRVSAYMKELEQELWKLGVLAKTKHNEVAPAQHELAPIFTTTNIATDHNQLTMELMKSIANKHGLACLLHEKPFAGVNGSGKHNNWSLSTDTGANLLEPGDTPSENAQFLLFLSAVIKAVDDYQDLLRVSVASAGNDHRLGANEAPPAIVSMFLGDELTEIITAIENGTNYIDKGKSQMEIGVRVLPKFSKDTTDRNRTSPFAFTGNKFEFRMLGSTFSIAGPNIVLNTIVAEELKQFADILEKSSNFDEDLNTVIKDTIRDHKRIIFNGNNYSDAWIEEAEKRGLLNLKTTPDALPYFVHTKNIELFTKHHVFSESELYSRYEILMENYCKTIHIEALTMIDMVKKYIIPSVLSYQGEISEIANSKKQLNPNLKCELEEKLLSKLSRLGNYLYAKLDTLETSVLNAKTHSDLLESAKYYRESIFINMQHLRGIVDELETLIAKDHWSLPTYGELLFSVN